MSAIGLLCTILCAPISGAVEPPPGNPMFGRYVIDDGLLQNYVGAIQQDSQGFMWFGTHGGLARFDGYTFTYFLKDAEDRERALSDNYIYDLNEDRQGVIWIASNHGLNRYDPQTNKLRYYLQQADNANSISDNHIRALFEDRQGRLWIGTRRGLNLYLPASDSFARYYPPFGENHQFIKSIVQSADGRLWLGTYGGGMIIFNPEKGEFTQPRLEIAAEHAAAITHIWKLVSDMPAQRIWIASEAGLGEYRIDEQRLLIHPLGGYKGSVTMVYREPTGTIWAAQYNGGLYRLRPGQAQWENFIDNNNPVSQLDVRAIYLDRGGVLWLGTRVDGLMYFKPDNPFRVIRFPAPQQSIWALDKDRHGNLWVGTSRGGVLKRLPDERYQIYMHNNKVPQSLSSNAIMELFVDRSDRVWVATNKALHRYDAQANAFQAVHFENYPDQEMQYFHIGRIVEKQKDEFYFASYYGLFRWQVGSPRVESIAFADQSVDSSEFYDSSNLLLDSKNRLWFLGRRMLARLDDSSGKLRMVPLAMFGETPLFLDMVEDENGHLWIVGEGGLYKLDAEGQPLRHYDIRYFNKGLLYAILYDRGFLWLGGNKGLWRFDVNNGDVLHFNKHDGLQDNEFNYLAKHVDSDGTIYMGGVSGISVFRLTDIQNDSKSPPPAVILSRLWLDNQLVTLGDTINGFTLQQELPRVSELRLNYHQSRFFALEYSALDYKAPRNNRYAYKLEGFNNSWIETDAADRRAVYTALSPGEYRFKVKAANADGVWSQSGVALDLIILPPWWLTMWAKVAYFILFILTLYGFIHMRTQRLRKQAYYLEKEVDYRTREIARQKHTIETLLEKKNSLFAHVSHELRTPLSLILGPVTRLLKNSSASYLAGQLQIIKRNGERLSELVDQLLEFARLSHADNAPPVQVAADAQIRAAHEALQTAIEDKALDFELDLGQAELWVSVYPRDAVATIVLNLLSNAIKYTPDGGRVSLRARQYDDRLRIALNDTGCGIAPDQQAAVFERFVRQPQHIRDEIPGAGLGLALVKELVERNQGSVWIESRPPEVGTTFIVELPLCMAPQQASNVELPPAVTKSVVLVERLKTETHHANQTEAACATPLQLEGEKLSLLLIDDHADMRSFLASELSAAYQVVTAVDGEDGLQKARHSIPDLIVCDVMMPLMDGFDVLFSLRADINTSHIPVILLTAKGDRDSRLRGMKSTADDYLVKPVDIEVLKARIDNLLAIRHLLRTHYRLPHNGISMIDEKANGDCVMSALDRQFLWRFEQLIEKHYQNVEFRVTDMCELMLLSQRPLEKKLKMLIGRTPAEYLRIYRLDKAGQLLEQGFAGNMSQLAVMVGFNSQQHFGSSFKAHYGISPKQFNKQRAQAKASLL